MAQVVPTAFFRFNILCKRVGNTCANNGTNFCLNLANDIYMLAPASEPDAKPIAGAGVFSDELKYFRIADCKEKQPVPSIFFTEV